MGILSKDVAVSLVDDSFIFSTLDLEAPLVLPAYVAIQSGTSNVLACGEEARAMLGREPNNINVIKVLVEGGLYDSFAATSLFRFGMKQVPNSALVKPRIIAAVRSYDLLKNSVQRMAVDGGAREVYLMEMGLVATAIGMQLDVEKPDIKSVLTISEDWFEFSIISLAGILAGVNGNIGVNTFVEDIQNHISLRSQFRPEFEMLRSQLISDGINSDFIAETSGWEVWSGRSEQGRMMTQKVTKEELSVGMSPSLIRMCEKIKSAIRELPDSKQAQLSRTTIHATGDAMKIHGLRESIQGQIGYSIIPFDSKYHPSIDGAKRVIKELPSLKKAKYSAPR